MEQLHEHLLSIAVVEGIRLDADSREAIRLQDPAYLDRLHIVRVFDLNRPWLADAIASRWAS
jgi:hypothetical protein